MKKIVTAGISANISLSVLGASLSTPAHAGKKERRIAAGVAIGAVAGLIIAGELNRRVDRVHYRKRDRHFRKHRRHQRRSHRWQRDRYFDDYINEDRPQPRTKNSAGKRVSNQPHIQRCTKAYRSYDPQSDTYIGYDGRERICRK